MKLYVAMHGCWLVLYAVLGKGFAYAGFAPFYVGELLLLFGLLALLGSRRAGSLMRSWFGLLFLSFLIWQALCAIPYLQDYGIDTLRDSAVWSYGAFAWISAALILRLSGILRIILAGFARYSAWFLLLGPAAWIATLYFQDWLPHWNNSSVSIPYVKGGDFLVHLAGVFAFASLGISKSPNWVIAVVFAESLLGMRARGGMVAFAVSSIFVLFLRPRLDRLAMLGGAALLLIATMATFDIRIQYPGSNREMSLEHLSESITSMVDSGEHSELESTKAWRLNWWNRIWMYTVEGPYFWMGKGYGLNLADSDGFQVGTQDEPLRSPHNSHLTLLARSGVPGFVLWVGLQVSWFAMMMRGYLVARRLRAREWIPMFAWLASYWLAFMTCAAFDVFLEGPMAGIPFWTLFGVGWGAYRHFASQLDPVRIKGNCSSIK